MPKGATPQTQTQTVTSTPSPQATELLDLAMPYLRQFAASPPKLPAGSSVAGFDPAQVQGQNMALTAAGGQQDVVGGAASANQRLTSGELMDPTSNPALRSTIDAATQPIRDQLLQETLPNIRSGAAVSGNYGSTRQGIAEGLASGKASQAIGNTAANIATHGYDTGLDALVKGVGLAPTSASGLTIPALTTSGVGDVRQALQQAILGENYNRDLYGQLSPLLVGQQLAGIAAGVPGGSSTATGAASTARPNPLTQGLGGALAGAQLGSMLLPGVGTGIGAGLGGLLAFL